MRLRVTIADIQAATCSHFAVSQIHLVSERRAAAIARPRQIAMYLAKRMTGTSLPGIGRKFGDRDHTTVIHAVRRIEGLRLELSSDIAAIAWGARRVARRRNVAASAPLDLFAGDMIG